VPDPDLALMWMCNTDHPGTVPGKINDEFFELVKETAAK
jgi:predicted AlkP superfamily pyrophosphatase or phosphodiesterase